MPAVGRSFTPGVQPGSGLPVGALAPSAPFTPQDYDSALVHISRGEALNAITMAFSSPDGYLHAWEQCVSFAEALMPLASTDAKSAFIRRYTDLVLHAKKTRRYPLRALWRLCSLEMKRQGRLGVDDTPLPMDKERFGLEAQDS